MNIGVSKLKFIITMIVAVVLGIILEMYMYNLLVVSAVIGFLIGIIIRNVRVSLYSTVAIVTIWWAVNSLYFIIIPGSSEITVIVSDVIGFSPYVLFLIPLIIAIVIASIVSISVSLILSR